ncbi:MAG: UDP-4-amino-4,6-dideoxy-N-acetyl-beta-L-altrosamine transaminase [Alphaproteobacteria bacterium]|jgi:UDP-4-amino-4,6-dideoxy-N-acetyl-beta-L-altrosamine transaminase|nr:UDP-4-amino-4,6-dideoxy-N-acetyl-beta-L-altrosamine transaminase [Alphaproteobacteria bacterium]
MSVAAKPLSTPPVILPIPYGRQAISAADIAAVVRTLESDYLTQGPAIPAFERAFADAHGAAHAIAVNSATAALHIVYQALGLGKGDTLWTVPNTFVATANAARYLGADVDFVDTDAATFLMCPKDLAARLEKANAAGCLPKIITPVHFAGQSAAMKEIHTLAQRYGVAVVEDASHAVGAEYNGAPVGSCPYSDAAVFSFHPVKIITTGEGGMITTRNPALAHKVASLRTHGITKTAAEFENTADGGWYYEMQDLGLNYRLTDIQAALGLSQLQTLPENIARRRALARRYQAALSGTPGLTLQQANPDGESSWHLFVVLFENAATRRRAYDTLKEKGIYTQVHYMPVHLQPYYQRLGFQKGQYPHAEEYYSRCLSLPMFHTLTDAQQDYVITELKGLLA